MTHKDTSKDTSKPVTLADYIPPDREPEPKAKRRRVSKRDRDRLDALEREFKDETAKLQLNQRAKHRSNPKVKLNKKKLKMKTVIFYIIALIIILNIID